MVFGFKGDKSKLSELYKELGLNEVNLLSLDELEDFIKKNTDKCVIKNYNELMVYENATADIVERRNKVIKSVNNRKADLFLGLTKFDPGLDKIKLDVAIVTKINTNDMVLIEEIFNFVNTDIPYRDEIKDNEYVLKKASDERGTIANAATIKKLINN